MITTDKFVFVHMHKTGGQSLGHIIEASIPGMRHIGYHYPYEMLPAEYASLPVSTMSSNAPSLDFHSSRWRRRNARSR